MIIPRRININRAPFLAMLFIYLYIPVFFGFFSAYFVGIFGCICIIHRNMMSKSIALYVMTIIFLSVYIVFVGVVSHIGVYNSVGSLLYLGLFSIPSAMMLVSNRQNRSVDICELIESVAAVSLFQSFISIVFFLFDSIRLPVLEVMGYDIKAPEWGDILSVRLYGVASGLTYSMPAVQAIIGAMILIYALVCRNKRIYLWMVPFIWFSAVINSRTAIVLIATSLVFLFIFMKRDFGGRNAKYLFAGILLGIVALIILMRVNPNTAQWIREGIAEIYGFFTGGDGGYYFSALQSDGFLELPKGIWLWIGTGTGSNKSDVGFVRYVWMMGILGSAAIYGLYYKFIIALLYILFIILSFGVFIIITKTFI